MCRPGADTRVRPYGERCGVKPRDAQARIAKPLAREELVARDGGRAWRMPRQAELFGDARGDHRRPVAHDHDPVDRSSRRHLEDRGGRCVDVRGLDAEPLE